MDNAGILIPLFGILCGIIAILSGTYIKAQKMKLEAAQANRLSSASETEMLSEIQRLKDRGITLSNIMIGGFPNTLYGRPGRDQEIEKVIRIDESIVMAALATAPSSFTLTGRSPQKAVHLGGDSLVFA